MGSPNNPNVPAERWNIAYNDADAKPERELGETALVLRLRRTCGPLLLLHDMA
jgi:hypothetical protein